MEGYIIKGIAGFYYISCGENIYECKAKGIFRKQGIKPLVGDRVQIEVLDQDKCLGNIIEILPRKNSLIRPAVANVDQAIVVFAMAKPDPNLNLLDRFLLMMNYHGIDTIICLSKEDIVSEKKVKELEKTYEKAAKKVITFSNKTGNGIEEIKDLLKDKITVLAGPSGVGKSSLLNIISPKAKSETGEISEKIGRGKHTTRHSELFKIYENSFLFDTPGFSSLQIQDIKKEDLKYYIPEFQEYEDQCKFKGCMHIHEPACAIKENLQKGNISQSRYYNYVQIFEELAETEKRNLGRIRK